MRWAVRARTGQARDGAAQLLRGRGRLRARGHAEGHLVARLGARLGAALPALRGAGAA